jgi:hypothetical protein
MLLLAVVASLAGCILAPYGDNPRSRRVYRDSAEPPPSSERDAGSQDDRDLDERSSRQSSRPDYSEDDGSPRERVVERVYYVPSYSYSYYDCYPWWWYPSWSVGVYWHHHHHSSSSGSSGRVWRRR